MRKAMLLAVLVAGQAFGEVWKVVPGVGVGPIKLGQSCADVSKILTPGEMMGNASAAYLRYREGIDLDTRSTRVEKIIVLKNSFQAKTGPVDIALDGNIRIGSSVAQMQNAWGRENASHEIPVAKGQPKEWIYVYLKGAEFRTKNDQIVEVTVWKR